MVEGGFEGWEEDDAPDSGEAGDFEFAGGVGDDVDGVEEELGGSGYAEVAALECGAEGFLLRGAGCAGGWVLEEEGVAGQGAGG